MAVENAPRDGDRCGGYVLVSPDSFKGTMTAIDVADAVEAGIRDAAGAALTVPLADGGEGTLSVLRSTLGGDLVETTARDPLGNAMDAHFLLLADGRTAVVETATASGLHLVDEDRRDPWAATSAGTGDLIAAAVKAGAEEIVVGVGGSACTDGGLGAIRAVSEGGGMGQARMRVLCDVRTPFEQAAAVYAPQKGADRAMVERLTERLDRMAEMLERDPRGLERTGAAGGLSGGLWAQYDADLVSGIDCVLDMVRFDDLLNGARAVVTGEGRLDEQTANGKVVDGVLRRARRHHVPVWAVVGQTTLTAQQVVAMGLAGVIEAGTPQRLTDAGRRLGHDSPTDPMREHPTAVRSEPDHARRRTPT